MCIVSAVGDSWSKEFIKTYPDFQSYQFTPTVIIEYATKQEVNDLRKEMEELKILLLAAKRFDEATGQPECQMEEKVGLIKGLAELLGIDMSDVFPENNNEQL